MDYHRYGPALADTVYQSIGVESVNYSVNTSMGEHIGSGYADLYKDLTLGRVSAWQQYTLCYPTNDNGAQYFIPSSTGTNVIWAQNTKFFRQVFHYVRTGAIRVSATSGSSEYKPLAFINNDGRFVVIIWKTSWGAGSFNVSGLPAGTYGINFTAGDVGYPYPIGNVKPNVEATSVTINSGQFLATSIPDQGVLTIYDKASTPVLPTQTPTPTSIVTPIQSPTSSPKPTSIAATATPTPEKQGDANGDNKVDLVDYVTWLNNYGKSVQGATYGDFNNDSKVDLVDYVIWLNNYGT